MTRVSAARPGRQLTLPVGLADEATLENFAPRAALAPLLAAVQAPREQRAREPLTFLHGPADVGKSHLLQALCHREEGAVYLPLATLAQLPAGDLLAGLETAPLIAIDDVGCIAAIPAWEEGLFHLINRARQAGCPLWFAARRPPAELGVVLEDLRSRLAGGVTWALPPVGDEDKAALLTLRAERRGLLLPSAVAAYLCRRGSRKLGDLLACLDRLDAASLEQQRPLTVPLVREVMGW